MLAGIPLRPWRHFEQGDDRPALRGRWQRQEHRRSGERHEGCRTGGETAWLGVVGRRGATASTGRSVGAEHRLGATCRHARVDSGDQRRDQHQAGERRRQRAAVGTTEQGKERSAHGSRSTSVPPSSPAGPARQAAAVPVGSGRVVPCSGGRNSGSTGTPLLTGEDAAKSNSVLSACASAGRARTRHTT